MAVDCYISVDIEADGPVPGPFSMLSLGAVVVDEPEFEYYRELRPISDAFDKDALAVTNLNRRALARHGSKPQDVMEEFASWVDSVCPKGRQPVFVAFNAPFDWSFVNYYFVRFGSRDNPFGHSALDLKAYLMGVARRAQWSGLGKDTLGPRLRPVLPHTHHALDDAREQAQFFLLLRAAVAQGRRQKLSFRKRAKILGDKHRSSAMSISRRKPA